MSESIIQTEEFRFIADLVSNNLKQGRKLELSIIERHVKVLNEQIENLTKVWESLDEELHREEMKVKKLENQLYQLEDTISELKGLKRLLSIPFEIEREEE